LKLCEGNSFRMQINFIIQDTDLKQPVNIKVKKIIDVYDDISGYLIIVSRVKNLDYLKSRYGITGRETEVIRQLAVGKSNKDIALILNIKENTVETHVTSIYNKIGIKNRIELLNLLFEYALSNPQKTIA
jgi:DNA-binding CsgD family transcriptional regulator